MKVLAYVNLPFDIDLRKEKAYISLKDGYYVQKVKLMPMPNKKSVELACQKEDEGNDYGAGIIVGWNECIEEIEK